MASRGVTDTVEEDLNELHIAYRTGRLRILVGAGASIQAGFPSWNKLDLHLLSAFLKQHLEKMQSQGFPLVSLLPDISNAVYSRLGREALDLVWENSEPRELYQLLADVLYSGRALNELPVPSLHRQIAAMTAAVIFTANYDPLLELAMLRVRDSITLRPGKPSDDWRKYLATLSWNSPGGYLKDKVYHLHGFVEPNGQHQGQCVFTEGHYFELASNQKLKANVALLDALQEDGVLLVVGMSLNDANLRRMLYERRKDGFAKDVPIYAVLKEEEELVSAYQQMHWKSRGVKVIWIRDYDDIENLLRQVKFGPYVQTALPPWVVNTGKWLHQRGFPDRFFEEQWQKNTNLTLVKLREQISLLFPRSYGEHIELNFLSLVGDPPKLCLLSRTQELPDEPGQARARAELFSFELGFTKEHGSSGLAFVLGQPDQAIDNPIRAHRNIGPDRVDRWYKDKGFQDWRSILSIPIIDSEDWIPVGVVSITSNFARPFWSSFDNQRDQYLSQLKAVVRGAVGKFILKKAH